MKRRAAVYVGMFDCLRSVSSYIPKYSVGLL